MTIELRGVAKSYGDHQALRPTDLTVDQGEFVTLLGPSGCGKTTMLRIIAGFVEPTQGSVLLDGTDITATPENEREVGLLFQSYALFPHLSVHDNVAFGPRMRKVSRSQTSRRVDDMLELVSMAAFRDRFPAQLSGGQQQRVALARLLAIEPRVLLLDEPLAALDRQLRAHMQVELARLIAEVGITTIFVTHDQEEALTMSDRVAVMNSGVIVQCGTPRQVYDHPETSFAASFVGDSNLLSGRIETTSTGREFTIDALEVLLPPEAGSAVADGPATLLVRPEHVTVDDTEASLQGRVVVARTAGDASLYEVQTDAGPLLRSRMSRRRDRPEFARDDRVGLSLETNSCWVLPPDEPDSPSAGAPAPRSNWEAQAV